jgi:hypothetical protein
MMAHPAPTTYSVSTGGEVTFTLASGARARITASFPDYSNNEERRGQIYLIVTSPTNPAVTGVRLDTPYYSPGQYDITNNSPAAATFTARVVSNE